MRLSRSQWKNDERRIAKELGTNRNPNNGKVQLDICAGHYGIEHKSLSSLPKWATDAIDQVHNGIKRTCPCGNTHDIGVVVVTGRDKPRSVKRMVIMDWEDWKSFAGYTMQESDEENALTVETTKQQKT
jgi:hypothetical protein